MKPESEINKRIATLSPAQRAALMRRLQDKGEVSARDRISRRDPQQPALLSFAQESLWFLAALEPESRAYNSGQTYHLKGALNVVALQKSFEEILRRHEALRTTFASHDGSPVPVIAPHGPLKLPIIDLTIIPREQRAEDAMRWAEAEFRVPFDLSTGPLMRATLLRLEEQEHLLVFSVHHIVYDGWSADVLGRELSAFYDAISLGRAPDWPDLPIQYADYAAWQRQRLTGEQLELRLAFWRKQLSGAAALDLLTDRPRPAHQTYQGARLSFILSSDLAAKLEKFNRKERVTPFMTLLSAFAVLLFRRSDQEDIIVGTPIANRPNAELEELIGFFVNSLVMRIDLSGAPSFRDLVGNVRQTALDAYQHQDLPFEKLVEDLNPERHMSRHPLFQVMFALQNAPRQALTLSGIEASRKLLPSSSTRFDLEMHLYAEGDGWGGFFVYSRDLFEEGTIEGMVRQYITLLEGMLAQPECPVSLVSMMPDRERKRILIEWNATTVDYPRDCYIHKLFEEQAKQTPQAVAVVFGEKELRYGELDHRSAQLARYLSSLGVGPGARVAICVEPSADMVVGLLGILKAGAAYVPIDPRYPEERISFILADTDAAALLTRKGLASRFSLDGLKIVCLDGEWEAIESSGDARHQSCAVEAGDVAYVIFTSGSTGKPKGVCVPHRAVNRLVVNCDYVELGADDVVAQISNCCFDAATFEIWGALLNGSRLVGIELEHLLSPESFSAELVRHGVTTLFLTTALFNELVHERANIFGKLRNVLFGGEEADSGAVRKVLESGGPPQRLVNLYGPTEATTFATWYEIRPGQSWTGRIPIGRPIANTQVYILDGHLNAVPVGMAGEICIGGEGVATGYLNRPELTEERFIASPFAGGRRLYRTGDRGRFLPDGNVEFLGRLDNQVKVRGFRIELGEIEVALASHRALRQAVVCARESDRDGRQKQLVAYVVLRDERTNTGNITEELVAFLKQKLPDYMVPSAFVVLEKLPLTNNGKVHRRALPAPSLERRLEGYRAPRTPREEILCGIYADLLSLERVGINENFFSLGGHSLLAMQVVSRVRSVLGVELTVRAIFETPSVAELIARLPGAQKARAPLLRQERPERLPLSFAQQRLWFLDRLENSGVEYNVRAAWRLRGELDVSALGRAINALVERHETLRTHFEEKAGEPFQVIESEVEIPLRVEDLSSLGENERQRAIESALRREAEQPFDLREGPLLRMGLLRLGAYDHILLWSCHHIISDGWSMAVFHRDVRLGYEAFCEGGSNPLESLQIQYADYALWQRSWMQGRELERLLGYWRGQLAGAATLELTADRPRPPRPSYLGGRNGFMLGPELSARLAEFNRREKEVTPFMSLLAAFEVLLYRYSGQADFMVGTPVANRPNVELEGLIGFFVNVLAMRADLRGEPSFQELVGRVRRAALDGYQHQDLPFEKLVEELNPGRDMSRHPLFQVMFALQNAPHEALELRGVEVSRQLSPSLSTRFDLELHLSEQGDGWSGSLVYSRDLFDETTIETMVCHYVTLLEGMLQEPERPVSQVPMMAEIERERILVRWNATGVEYPRDRCIHSVFEEQARRAPQAVAVVYGEQELSYGELERRSAELAGYLRSLGVGVGARVAICMEPSAEMIVGLLGILKAGGAYVPIDPGYPEERICLMLAESEAGVLLSREGLAGRFSGKAVKIVCLDTGWEPIARVKDTGQQLQAAEPEDVAYVLFTSGSTGTPKGVCVPHRAVNRLVVNCDYVRLGPEEVVAQISNCCFDATTFEIWGALLNGSRLVGIERERVLSAESFSAELARHGVTTLFVTTALFNELVHERANIFSKVRNVLFGGEECDPGAVRKVLENGPPQRLLHVYGPTETTTLATWCQIKADQSWAGRIPIGRPIANTQVYILDTQLNPVPIGVPGEIWIGGGGVARGYLNRPELTAERFIQSPFLSWQRLYRTGDLGRFLSDGNIDFLGRRDHQVKIRGFRIELGEIEAALATHPEVRQAVVCAREGGRVGNRTGRHLVAYMVLAQGGNPDGIHDGLRSFLKRKLPDYMVPTAFVVLQKLPLTPNGKIAHQALPSPEWKPASDRAPRTPEEEILCAIYAELLSLAHVGINDSFFSLGGHSLLAMRLINQVRHAFGVELSVREIFEAPSVAELVTRVSRAGKANAPLVPQERPQRPPLSFAQERLWFLDRLETSSTEYNISQALRLSGELDVSAIGRAIDALVERHEILRTSFGEHEGEPCQIVAPHLRIPLEVEDLSDLGEDLRQEVLQATLRRESQKPFELSAGPLLRIGLLKLGPQDHILHWTCHHAIFDGWSAGVFIAELSILYAAFSEGCPAKLAALPVQYVDYALWQRRQMDDDELERLVDYWRGQLRDLPVLDLPIDRPRSSSPNFGGGAQMFLLPESLCRDLRSLGGAEGASMAMVLLAAFELLLGRLCGQDDVAMGFPIAGRSSSESEGLIGLFVNTLVLRAKLDGSLSFRQLLAQVRKSSLEAYAHQEMPFEKLVEVLNPERVLNRHPLFEVLFNYIGISRPSLDLPGLSIERFKYEGLQAKFPMTLYLEEISGGLMLRLAYQTALFRPERIAHLVDQFHHLLIQVAANPDKPIYAYSLATEAARKVLPNPTIPLGEPKQIPVTSRFLSQAKLHADHSAVRHEGREWTYRELAKSSQQIAALLTARGVRPGEVIAVTGQRSFGLISGILGVLLARGVLLTLDSSLPIARRDQMLRDASGKHRLFVGDPDDANEEDSETFHLLPVTRISFDGDLVDVCDRTPSERTIPGEAKADEPAYVFFTSGTTGVPKGILGTHKGLSHFLQWEQDALGVDSNDRVAQLTGLSFDVVLRDIFLPLSAGATLCLPDTASVPHGNEVVGWMRRERITILHTVPSLAAAWLDSLDSRAGLPDLRWTVMAGEPLTDTLVRWWREQMGTTHGILNLYGPTETTLAKCAYRVPADPGSGVQPIGEPLPDTQALIINKADQLCGIGEPGEIVIRSSFRTLGYLNATGASRTGFVPNPFRDDLCDVVYRSGDCGSYDNEGLLHISGRLDEQVKIRGNRIEPSEVAAVLGQYSGTQECAVVAREAGNGEKCLVAYLVQKTAKASPSALRDFLKQKLPDYMIPAGFVVLDKLPLTPNGKLDRQALPAPDTAQSAARYLAPRDPTERTLAKLWSDLLKLDKVGVQDDFFALGGHSLLATRLVSQIRREFDVEIPLRAIFENPTIERLALQIAEKLAASILPEGVEELLNDLESLPEEAAEGRLNEVEQENGNAFPSAEGD